MLGGSESFRLEVAKSLLNKKEKKKKMKLEEKLILEFKQEIKKKFPLYATEEKIPAIKFVRTCEKSLDLWNALKKADYIQHFDAGFSLFEAKKFVESL